MVSVPPTSVADLFRHRSRDRAERIALICDGRTTTYAALDRRANQVAHALLSHGGERRVALLDTNSDVFFELLGGAAKAGYALVPINWRLQIAEIAAILDDAVVDLLLVGVRFADRSDALRAACPRLQTIILVDPSNAEDPYGSWRDRQPDDDPGAVVPGGAPLLHVYTSGTEGLPRGVPLTSDNVMVGAPTLVVEFGEAEPGETALVALPLFHVAGSLWGVACLYAGATCVVLGAFDPGQVLRIIANHRIAKLFLVPALIRMLLEAQAVERVDLSSLRLIVYGAAPMPTPLMIEALGTFGCAFAQVYGLTETCGAITYLRPADHDPARPDRLLSCGRPLAGVEIRIADDEGHAQPAGTIGEVVCRTKQNMSGYWRQSNSAGAFFHGGWLRTGDAGWLDDEGFLYITDRLKDVVITGGENVYPSEVERTLLEHPAVADAAVIGVPDDHWGEAVHAFVVPRAGIDAGATDILAFARTRLAAYKVPKRLEFADALPRNAAGKVLKRSLREPYWRGRLRQID